MGAQCEFMYDKMTGPGLTGLYASCGYTKYHKELDCWTDELMDYITDMDPDREWELWCQQWHMYKRDLAIGVGSGVAPKPGVRYEKVCAYLEALTRIEVQETPSKRDAKAVGDSKPSQVHILLIPLEEL